MPLADLGDVKIVANQLMPMNAVCPTCVDGLRAYAATNVLLLRNRLQMTRVDTRTIATEVINLESIRDVYTCESKGYTVSQSHPAIEIEDPVAPRISESGPVMTLVRTSNHLSEESVLRKQRRSTTLRGAVRHPLRAIDVTLAN